MAQNWQDDQIVNGEEIISVAKSLGLGIDGQVIGIMAALTESTLHNVNYGDHPPSMGGAMSSSRGLFQQIAAWGPESDRLDPVKAARMFYTGGQEGQRGLLDIPNWQNLDPWVAAQAVQQSEFSDGSNYRANYLLAQQFVGQYGSGAAVTPGGTGGEPQDDIAKAWIVPAYTINGVSMTDKVWKSYLTANGTANFGVPNSGKIGNPKITPGAIDPSKDNITLPDKTIIDIHRNDDLTAIASAGHMEGKTQISRIDFDANSRVVDFAGPSNVIQSGDGTKQTGAGATPVDLTTAAGWETLLFGNGSIWGILQPIFYGLAGGILIILGIYMFAKDQGIKVPV